MPIFSASLIRSSLKSGCAMLIKLSALCHVDLPFRFAAPYSVTMKFVAILGVVTMEPGVRVGAIKDSLEPSFSVLVDGVQIKL